MMTDKLEVTKLETHVPGLSEVVNVLQKGLADTFSNVTVGVADCPDLTQPPFYLSSEGLCGNPRLADIGGPPYLIPIAQKNKIFNFKKIAELSELPNAFMIGAGAGPYHVVGVNSETLSKLDSHAMNVKGNNESEASLRSQSEDSDQPETLLRPHAILLEMSRTGSFTTGAGAGPYHVAGVNSELMNNVKYQANGEVINNAYTAKLDLKTGECVLEKSKSEDFCLMGNFLISDGRPGKVIEVKASKRHGSDDFVNSIRNTLQRHYSDKVVGLGGVFLVEKGSAHLHIMPDFPKEPFKSKQEVDTWLQYFDMDPTLVCVGELISHDPGLDLRVEHFHCFSTHGQGGHYHWDTTPDEVEYRGYFVVVDCLYRIDQPPKQGQA